MSGIRPVPKVLTWIGHRFRDADGVGHLDQALVGKSGGHEVLREMTRRVCRAAVHLGRILAGERAAAVRCASAVGIDDDLPPGQTGVAVRSADLEPAGRVDVDDRVLVQHIPPG